MRWFKRNIGAVIVGGLLSLLIAVLCVGPSTVAQIVTPTVFSGPVVVTGNLSSSTFSAPAGCISDAAVVVPSAGANGINTTKLNHRQHVRYSQAEGTSIVTETRIVWLTNGTQASFISARAIEKTATSGGDTVTVDIRKNGTSILSGATPISVTGTSVVIGTITTTSSTVGDYVEVVVTATHTSGTLGQGLYVDLIVDESPT